MSQSQSEQTIKPLTLSDSGLRGLIAGLMGVGEDRRIALYKDISVSASLLDIGYWLQILFAAGIATLGLALNSPAVIIGAMLISPLMGPILSAGLALASGNVILGIRATIKLTLSCFLAIAFAIFLVAALPFKEITSEIAARTQPNTLDLLVALFSGAIGSLATCRETKGVATSIPGVAIAVALMPPLCVVGFGFAIALTVDLSDGIRTARGGGLLFLTNLVAITFTAMVVFLLIHIDTEKAKIQIRKWMLQDQESLIARDILKRFRLPENVRKLGSLPGRLMMIIFPILLLMIPLSQSLLQLRDEIITQRNENRIRRDVSQLWEENFGKSATGVSRSFIDQISVTERGDILSLFMRAFTSQPVNQQERREFIDNLALKLNKPPQSLDLQLVEIPTTSAEVAARASEEKKPEPPPPTVAKLQSDFLQGLDRSLQGLRFPAPAALLTYEVNASLNFPLQLSLVYLSERDIETDGLTLIADEARRRTNMSDLKVEFRRIPSISGPLEFASNRSILTPQSQSSIDPLGQSLQQWASLKAVLVAPESPTERAELSSQQQQAILDYLQTTWQIDPGRITVSNSVEPQKGFVIQLQK